MRCILIVIALVIISLSGCINEPKKEAGGFCETIVNQFGDSIRCGSIQVSENHSLKDGRTITIAYSVILSKTKSGKPPILFLNGGPGSKSLQQISRWYESPLRNEHDIILFDHRGTGYSSPLPDIGPAMVDIIASDLSATDEATLVQDALSEAANDLREQGIDASCFNVFQSAKDVVMLMAHLGYDKYVMLGVSYGTKLSQIVARDNPERVKSLVLYGPAPVFVNFYGTVLPYFENSVNACAVSNPDIVTNLQEALLKAKEKPFEIVHQKKTYHLNPQDILMVSRYLLYRPDGNEALPAFVDALNANDTTRIRELGGTALTTILGSNFTMYLSSMLYDEYLDTSEETYLNSLKNSSLKDGIALVNSYIKWLPILHKGRVSESEKIGGKIDIPTLILVNKFDPATPSENVKKVHERIPKARLVKFERHGHIIWDSASHAAVLNFWSEPSFK